MSRQESVIAPAPAATPRDLRKPRRLVRPSAEVVAEMKERSMERYPMTASL